MAAKFGLLIDAKTKGENNIKRLGNSMQGVEGKAKNLGMAVRGVGNAFKAFCDIGPRIKFRPVRGRCLGK